MCNRRLLQKRFIPLVCLGRYKDLKQVEVTYKMWIALGRCLASKLFLVHRRSPPLGRAVFRWLTVSRKLNCMTAESDRPHIGIVGSGPAGFYTAQQILKVSSSKGTQQHM